MRVFISWSGPRSRWVADALHEWVPIVIQDAEPFLSADSIDAGSNWVATLAEALQNTKFAISCITPENMNAPWLLFEAGAVSKALDTARVCPYLLEIDRAQLQGPLAQFQANAMDEEGTWNIVKSLNNALGGKITESRLKSLFDSMFSKLDEKLRSIPSVHARAAPKRSMDSMVKEILEKVRGLERTQTRALVQRKLGRLLKKAQTVPGKPGYGFVYEEGIPSGLQTFQPPDVPPDETQENDNPAT